MLIRPAVLEAIGGMDENYFLYVEETDFCYRAKKVGFATWYVPESRVMAAAVLLVRIPTALLRNDIWNWPRYKNRYRCPPCYSIGLVKRAACGRTHTAIPRAVARVCSSVTLRVDNGIDLALWNSRSLLLDLEALDHAIIEALGFSST